jgi:hypothetical protein
MFVVIGRRMQAVVIDRSAGLAEVRVRNFRSGFTGSAMGRPSRVKK